MITCHLSHISPVTHATCHTCHLSHMSPATHVTCHTCHLSHMSPVTHVTPVTYVTCHTCHLSRSALRPVSLLSCRHGASMGPSLRRRPTGARPYRQNRVGGVDTQIGATEHWQAGCGKGLHLPRRRNCCIGPGIGVGPALHTDEAPAASQKIHVMSS